MSQSAYDLGYEDGKNDNLRKDREPLAEMFLDTVTLGTFSELSDFDYDEYNRGYDDGEAAAEKEKEE